MSTTGDEYEDDRRTAETNRIAAEGGRIGAETDRVTAAAARDDQDSKVHAVRVRKDIGQLMAYVLIVTVGVLGFWQLDRTNEEICRTADDNRDAIRGLVTATELLGRSLIVEGKPEEEWSPGERQAMSNLAEFKDSQIQLLNDPVC